MPKLSDFDPKDIKLHSPAEQMEADYIPKEDKLSLGDVAAMVGQGATFGFGDELLGAIKAAYDVALTDKDLSDIGDLYREHQKEEARKYKELEEAHPGAALAGELAGGFLLPGGWLAKGGLKGATVAQKVLEGAKIGAKAGAISGAGTSEYGVDDITELGRDILKGGASGAIFGGTLTGAGAGLAKVPEKLEKLKAIGPLGENLVRAFKESKAGREFITPSGEQRINEAAEKASKELTESVIEPVRNVTKEITEHFEEAGKAGAKVQPDAETIEEVRKLILAAEGTQATEIPTVINKKSYNAKKRAIQKKLDDGTINKATYDAEVAALDANPPLKKTALSGVTEQIVQQTGTSPEGAAHPLTSFAEQIKKLLAGELTPQEALNLGKLLSGKELPEGIVPLDKRIQQLVSSALPEKLEKAAYEAADTTLGLSGKSEELMTKFADVRRLLPETITNKGVLEQFANKLLNKFGTGPQALNDAASAINSEILTHIIHKLADPSSTGDDVRNTVRKLAERVSELNKKYPDLKLDFNKVIDNVKTAAQDKTIRAKIITKHGEKDSVEGLLDKMLNWTGYGGASLLGWGTRGAEKGMQAFNNFITTASDVTLMPIAKALQAKPGVSHFGAALEGALNNKSIAAKNAAIFSIMQNPEARKTVSEVGFADQED